MAAKAPAVKLRAFRHSIAILKKKGLVSHTIDARKVKPTKHYESVIRKFAGVVSGKQTTVKVSRRQALRAREELGFAGARNRVIIDKFPDQKIVHRKSDPFGFHVKYPGSIEHIELSGPPGKSMRTHINKLMRQAERLQKPGYRTKYGLKFYGNKTKRTFETREQILNYLLRYASIQSAEDENDPDRIREQIESISLYRMPVKAKWYQKPPRPRKSRKRK